VSGGDIRIIGGGDNKAKTVNDSDSDSDSDER